jgi:hypothetical protein
MCQKDRLKEVWEQRTIPVVLRRGGLGEKLRVRLPESDDEFEWLRNCRPRKPIKVEDKDFWELPKKWFNDLVERSLDRFGRIYIIQPYRNQEKCAPACQNARGHECNCSCMGEHHGAGNDGSWFEVSDAFSTRWQDRELACRLLTKVTE